MLDTEATLEFDSSDDIKEADNGTLLKSVVGVAASSVNLQDQFLDLGLQDYSWRLKNRKWYAGTIVGVLITQNLATYFLIFLAFFMHQMVQLQLLLGIFLPGTFVETYFIFHTVVKWLFNEIDYKAYISAAPDNEISP